MKPIVEPLAKWRRKLIFIVLLLAFILALPVFMFYATGYRYDIFSTAPTITATGGLYISAEALDSKIFIDEVEVTNARIFRKASYIQGLEPDLHHVHVQSLNRHTWVKDLSVYPHIVTEASAFNLPLVSQIRPITKYQTTRGEGVVFVKATSTPVFSGVSTTVPYIKSTSTATSTLKLNSEYDLLVEQFAELASTTALIKKTEQRFGFASTTATTTNSNLATTTVERGKLRLTQRGEDVVAIALGSGNEVPHYFCLTQTEIKNINKDLGASAIINDELLFEEAVSESANNNRECRKEIVIDRQEQKVLGFNFWPEDENLVLLNLERGIYVVEIDDRSWQNAQPLYLADGVLMLINNGRIFAKDKDNYFELLTDIPVI